MCNHLRWGRRRLRAIGISGFPCLIRRGGRDMGRAAIMVYRNTKLCCISNVLEWAEIGAGSLILRLFGEATKGALFGVRGFPSFAGKKRRDGGTGWTEIQIPTADQLELP
jgi:hypothetical protein